MFIELGELRFKVLERIDDKNKTYFRTMVFIDSYPGIPFVDLHDIYESNYDVNDYSVYFKAVRKLNEKYYFTFYTVNEQSNRIEIKKGLLSPFKIYTDSSCDFTHRYQDGLSLFYYARRNAGKKEKRDIECFIDEKYVQVDMNFDDEPERVENSYIDYAVECIKIDGKINFESIFGLTGDYSGWFSDDDCFVPVLAKLNVIIGQITLQLKSWHKPGWKPPKYGE